MQKRNKLTLQDWINKEGTTKIAQQLDVDMSSVRQWRINHCLPRAEQMIKIKKLTKGKLTCDTMIENFLNSKNG